MGLVKNKRKGAGRAPGLPLLVRGVVQKLDPPQAPAFLNRRVESIKPSVRGFLKETNENTGVAFPGTRSPLSRGTALCGISRPKYTSSARGIGLRRWGVRSFRRRRVPGARPLVVCVFGGRPLPSRLLVRRVVVRIGGKWVSLKERIVVP